MWQCEQKCPSRLVGAPGTDPSHRGPEQGELGPGASLESSGPLGTGGPGGFCWEGHGAGGCYCPCCCGFWVETVSQLIQSLWGTYRVPGSVGLGVQRWVSGSPCPQQAWPPGAEGVLLGRHKGWGWRKKPLSTGPCVWEAEARSCLLAGSRGPGVCPSESPEVGAQ